MKGIKIMDFTLSKEHEMARQLFKEFAKKEVKPLAQPIRISGSTRCFR